MLLIKTTATNSDSGLTEVSRHRAPVDAELGGELPHRLARLVLGDQGVELCGFERPSSPRLGPRNPVGQLGLPKCEALGGADVLVNEPA